MARLNRFQTPPQFTLSFSELEWLGYKAACARMQQSPDGLKIERNKKGPELGSEPITYP
jgi:hypothetical protein